MADLMVNPPNLNECDEDTVKKYENERQVTFDGLKSRLKVVNKLLNEMDNITSVNIEGALYAFPRVRLSKKAVLAAKRLGLEADAFYCL